MEGKGMKKKRSHGAIEPFGHEGSDCQFGAQRAHRILAQGNALGRHEQKNCRLKACRIKPEVMNNSYWIERFPTLCEMRQPWKAVIARMHVLQCQQGFGDLNPICRICMPQAFSLPLSLNPGSQDAALG